MRITESISYRNLLSSVNMLNDRMEHASEQVSSGKRLASLHDGPADSSELMRLKSQLAQIDQYQSNADNGGFFLQVAESSLSSLHNLVTSVFVSGSAAANDTCTPESLAAIAAEIRSLRDQIFAISNTQVRGRYVFAGSRVTAEAFSIEGDAVTYNGDEAVNTLEISTSLQVRENIPGSAAFDDVFASVGALLAAVESGDQASIEDALGTFQGALATLSQVRSALGVDLAKLQDSEAARMGQETNIQSRQARIGNADLAAAIAELNRTQTALQAALTAGSLIGKRNLFDYLG